MKNLRTLQKVINILNNGGSVVIFDKGRNFSQHCELLGGLRINITALEMSIFNENNILASGSDVLNYITDKACIDLTNLPKFIVVECKNQDLEPKEVQALSRFNQLFLN